MIDNALQFLETFLNEELKRSLSIVEDVVIASSLVHSDGSAIEETQNKVVLSVIHVDQEILMKSQPNIRTKEGDRIQDKTPPLHLNLSVLVSFHQVNYLEALKMLSQVISTFQANSHFAAKTAPSLSDTISKLSLEMSNTSISELGAIWKSMGINNTPSLVYNVRMIAVQEGKAIREVSTITGLGNNMKGK